MKPKHLQDAIGKIDDAFIEEASREVRLLPKVWIPAASLAACILLTAALFPWKSIFSGNGSPVTDLLQTDNPTDVLQNNDTSCLDTTKEKEDLPDTTFDNIQIPAQSPDTSKKEETDGSFSPDVTLPPAPPQNQTPDTTGPSPDKTEKPWKDETTAFEKETTGPLTPNIPTTPDHGSVLPQRPTILSRSMYPVQDQYPSSEELRDEWRELTSARINYYKSKIGNTDSFMTRTVQEFFVNSKNENLVYSPVNAYMTLGTLAEAASGNSRAQLLSLIGEEDVYSLRRSAESVWNSCYRDDGIVTTVLGNSVWLDNSFIPKTAVTDVLANHYYASSFYGNMGDEEYNELMRSWINEQTKGLLNDKVSSSTLDPENTMALMSTVYFKANWEDVRKTLSKDFYSPEGKVTAEFMRKEQTEILYEGENFKTTRITFKEGGAMWFILPNENVSLQSLFSDSEAMGFITGKAQKTLSSSHDKKMVLYLPQFDITSEIDIVNGLKNLGITDMFDSSRSDFSTLTDSKICVGEINHSVRVRIDENGCEAAQIIENVLPPWWTGGFGATRPVIPVEFTLDRPFIFVVTSDSDLPLFVGTINYPILVKKSENSQLEIEKEYSYEKSDFYPACVFNAFPQHRGCFCN